MPDEKELDGVGVGAAIKALAAWTHDFRDPMARVAITAYLAAVKPQDHRNRITHCPCCGSPRSNYVCFGGQRSDGEGGFAGYNCSPQDHGRDRYGF
jgi:hypothetical protein